jgi:Sulfotransferase family
MLSPGRSFSTVISAMFGGHPEIHALPETCLFARETMHDYLVARGTALFDVGLRRAIERIFGGTSGDVDRWLDDREHLTTHRVFEELVATLPESVVVEKSPIHTSDPAHLSRIERLFGDDALYLHLTRHPAAYSASLLETYEAWKRSVTAEIFETSVREKESLFYGMVEDDSSSPSPYAVWLRRNATIMDFLSGIGPERRLTMQAERFLNEPEPALRLALHFIGIPATAADLTQMVHPERWAYASPPAGGRGGGDRKFFERPELQPDSRLPPGHDASAWRANAPLNVRKLAAEMGYI